MSMNITIEQVAQSPLFKNMTSDEVKDLLSRMNMLTKHVQKNDYIYLAGDVIENLCLVAKGSVQIVREDAEGEKSIVGHIRAGETFGENHFAAANRQSVVSYFVTETADIVLLPFSRMTLSVLGDVKLYSKFFTNMVAIVAEQNRELLEKVDILGKKTLRGKIMAYLEQQSAEKKSVRFEVPFSRTDMANYLDADRSAMTRELARMKDEGLIDFNKHMFVLCG